MELTRNCSIVGSEAVLSADFTIYKRTTFRPVFKFKNPNGSPMSLLNIVVTFYIEDDKAVQILKIDSVLPTLNGSRIIITDVVNGFADLLITDEETSLLQFKKANWWISIALLNGDVFTRGSGDIFLKQPFE